MSAGEPLPVRAQSVPSGVASRGRARLRFWIGLYLTAGGAVSIAGWAADLRRLTDWFDTGISIQPNAALAVTVSGLALLMLEAGRRRAPLALGLLVSTLGGAALFQWVAGVNLGLDALLVFGRVWGREGVLFTGRMGPPGALSWTLIGCGIALASRPGGSRARPVVPALALLTMGIASLSLIGYLYGVNTLYSLPTVTAIAFQTSTFVLAASIGLLLAAPEYGPMPLLEDAGPAGMMVRRILPAVVLVPIALGLARLTGDRTGVYDLEFGAAVRSISEIALLVALLWSAATVIRRQSQAREAAERMVEASEKRLRTIVDTVAVPLWEEDVSHLRAELRAADPGGGQDVHTVLRAHPEIMLESIRILDANDAAVTKFQAEGKAELIAAMPTLLRAAAPSLLSDRIVALAEGRSEFRAEARLHTLRGVPLHVSLTTVFPRAPHEEERALVSVVDLTEQKRVEEALRDSQLRLERDLADSQQLQRISAEVSHENPDSLYETLVDAALAITRAHGSKMQMLQHSEQGEPDRLRLIATRGLGHRAEAFWSWVGPQSPSSSGRAMRTGARVVVTDVLECPVLAHTEDLEVYLDSGIRAVQATPLLSRAGKLLGVLSTHWRQPHEPSAHELGVIDIVARQAADLIERRQNLDALRLADRRKDEFLMTLAHELRNPLAPVRSAVDLMKRKDLDDPDLQHARGLIDRHVTLMARLLDDLLDVGRIARDRLELQRHRVDLRMVMQGALELSAALVEAFKHELRVELPPGPIVLHGDPVRLGQIFGNLLNNACRYTEAGGQIWVTVRLEGEMAVVTVRDNGIGIPRDQLSSIFGIFSQVDRSRERSQGGLGIGLHLVKRLVELHGGVIEAHSEGEGRGSAFTVRLPAALAGDVRPAEAARTTDPRAEAPLKLLVVDDNVDAARALAMLLELDGHQTQVAYDGVEALEAADSFRPDAILLDVGLPRVNGLDVCRQIRAQAWGHDIVIMALTGWGQQVDRQLSHEAGFNYHLVKPIEHNELRGLLARRSRRTSDLG